MSVVYEHAATCCSRDSGTNLNWRRTTPGWLTLLRCRHTSPLGRRERVCGLGHKTDICVGRCKGEVYALDAPPSANQRDTSSRIDVIDVTALSDIAESREQSSSSSPLSSVSEAAYKVDMVGHAVRTNGDLDDGSSLPTTPTAVAAVCRLYRRNPSQRRSAGRHTRRRRL